MMNSACLRFFFLHLFVWSCRRRPPYILRKYKDVTSRTRSECSEIHFRSFYNTFSLSISHLHHQVTHFLNNEAKGTNIIGATSMEDMVSKLKSPRRVMLLVKGERAVCSVCCGSTLALKRRKKCLTFSFSIPIFTLTFPPTLQFVVDNVVFDDKLSTFIFFRYIKNILMRSACFFAQSPHTIFSCHWCHWHWNDRTSNSNTATAAAWDQAWKISVKVSISVRCSELT